MTDNRPDWMREHDLTRADLEFEANSDAPDAWVFEAVLRSLDERGVFDEEVRGRDSE